jgi:uncharacterized membrane protein YeaQ/YmgE (transglycosylase-associated protein family)
MWLIQFAIFGLVAGAIARLLHPGKDPMNWFWTMLLGMGGAVLGGWAANALGFDAEGFFVHWLAAIGGAVVLLVAYHAFTARRRPVTGPGTATSDDYKRAVFDDLSRGPRG